VSNRPDVYRIETKSGPIQVASLPWLRRSALLTKEDTKNLDFNQINEKMQQALSNIIKAHASELDPSLPSILAAHVGVASAMIGSERLMAIGQEHFLLISNIADPAFDYIALGHIHKHQVLSENPPVVYSGSLERVDFGEEKDEKGFYVIDIEQEPDPDKRKVSYAFHPVTGRSFRTIEVDIEPEDEDPTDTILKEIHKVENEVDNAVVRLQINIPEESESQIRDSEIREALKSAYYSTVSKDVSRESRIRLGAATVEEVAPVEALKTYLEANYSPERAEILLEYGQKLITGEFE
jgi:exonuclease SbcD